MRSPAVFPLADSAAPSLFASVELELLRSYLGLPPGEVERKSLSLVPDEEPGGGEGQRRKRRHRPAVLRVAEDDERDDDEGEELDLRRAPVRLSDAELNPDNVPLPDIQLAEAVGRLCASAIRKRLATWYQPESTGHRTRFPRPLARLLRPRLLCTINWSSWEWPEQYEVTYIQPLERFIVTVVTDTNEIWGCNRLALGSIGREVPLLPACERILSEWWAWHRDLGREEGWDELRRSGALNRPASLRLRRSVWDGPDYQGPRVRERVARVKRAEQPSPATTAPAPTVVSGPALIQDDRLQHLVGRQFDCVRCGSTGTICRRVCTSWPWPPWYVNWVRPPVAPETEEFVQCEAQAAPSANSFCPACRAAWKG